MAETYGILQDEQHTVKFSFECILVETEVICDVNQAIGQELLVLRKQKKYVWMSSAEKQSLKSEVL